MTGVVQKQRHYFKNFFVGVKKVLNLFFIELVLYDCFSTDFNFSGSAHSWRVAGTDDLRGMPRHYQLNTAQ